LNSQLEFDHFLHRSIYWPSDCRRP
jgi:hypothetical protein